MMQEPLEEDPCPPSPAGTPVVSICLPTLNARSFLEERIDSLFSQSLTDWELIACDSLSNDGTWEFLQSIKGDPRVRLYQIPRSGLYAGWNECLRRARAPYIHIATADDTCAPDFIEKLVGGLRMHPGAQVAFSDLIEIDDTGAPIPPLTESNRRLHLRAYTDSGFLTARDAFISSCHFIPLWNSMSSVVFRRSLLDRIGYFPTEFGSCGDVWWALAAACVSPFHYLDEPLATWRRHEAQATVGVHGFQLECQIYSAIRSARSSFHNEISGLFDGDDSLLGALFTYQDMRSREMSELTRNVLREDPARFLKSLVYYLQRRPHLVWSQFSCGFRPVEALPVMESITAFMRLRESEKSNDLIPSGMRRLLAE